MATTLVINPGSMSKKYALYKEDTLVLSMHFEHVRDGFGVCREQDGIQQKCEMIEAIEYKAALRYFLDTLYTGKIITSPGDIHAIGIRIVAPGSRFQRHSRIDDEYVDALRAGVRIAPLHINPVLEELPTVNATMSAIPLYEISDSAFQTSIPEYRTAISIPQHDAFLYGVRRYGYHGLSVASIARRTGTFFGVEPDRVVVCHVGGGVSVTALHYKESVDTSMGYSPASGLMMGSRAGDLSADALLGLIAQHKPGDVTALLNYLYTEGGFTGVAGESDLRLIIDRYAQGEEGAMHALNMFRYQLHRYIGGHVALLGGIDAFVFTATAVVRNSFLRAFLLEGLEGFGLLIDKERNDALTGQEGMIHSDHSPVPIGVMKTDEMGEIARTVSSLL